MQILGILQAETWVGSIQALGLPGLAGVLLGWLLHHCGRRWGKLHVMVQSFCFQGTATTPEQAKPRKSGVPLSEATESAECQMEVVVYNTREIPVVFRKAELLLKDGSGAALARKPIYRREPTGSTYPEMAVNVLPNQALHLYWQVLFSKNELPKITGTRSCCVQIEHGASKRPHVVFDGELKGTDCSVVTAHSCVRRLMKYVWSIAQRGRS